MQGKLFQRCTHLLYCSVLSLGGNVNTRRMSKPDMESIFHKNNQWNILDIGNYYVNYQNYQNSILLTSSDTKRTLRHLFLFTNSAQRKLVSMYAEYTQLQLTFLALHSWSKPSTKSYEQVSDGFHSFVLFVAFIPSLKHPSILNVYIPILQITGIWPFK